MKARNTTLALLIAVAAMAAAVIAPAASAHHVGNPDVGPYAQASVNCQSAAWRFSSQGSIEMSPTVGAATRFDEQDVAWVYYIKNETTGAGYIVQPGWFSMRHKRVTYSYVFDPFSPGAQRLQSTITPYAPGGSTTQYLPRGNYSVSTKYAWYTSTGWVESDWVKNTFYTRNAFGSTTCQL